MDEIYEINFAPNQQLPVGWKVVWYEGTEHYHFRYPDGELSNYMSVNRWEARWCALNTIAAQSNNPKK